MPDSKRDLELLCEAARASGEIARRHFRKAPAIWDKAHNAGPVTEADLAIDRMLRAELLKNRPDYGWLSEETEDDQTRLHHDHVFIVDPIDGTRAFIAGETSFSHSLAIARGGQITAAAVYVPMLDLLYTARTGAPATLNGQEITPSVTSKLEGATVLAEKPNMAPKYWVDGPPPVQRKFRPSLAYRLCLVAQGRYDAMLTVRNCWEWDIAAGDLIVRQARGIATDLHNQTLRFNNPVPQTQGCLAAGPALHAQLQHRLHRNNP